MSAESIVVGVGVVVLEDESILLIKRGREPAKGLWAIPGGKVEFGETLREAAIREAKEETGLEVEVGETVWVGERMSDDLHIVLVDFAASPIGGTLRAGDDADDARWVPRASAHEYPLTSSMYDLVDELKERQ